MPSLVGNKPNQVPSNGDLGTLAFQDSNAVNITGGVVDVSAGTAALPTLGTTGDPNTGVFFPAADTVAVATNGVEAVRVDVSGNLGIGLTPSAWGANYKVIEANGNAAALFAASSVNGVQLSSNTFHNGTSWTYKTTGEASRYAVNTNQHVWFNAPSGTANTTITWTTAMTLNASGNLGLGVTPSAWDSSFKAVQISAGAAFASATGAFAAYMGNNAYYNGGWKYIAATASSMYYNQTGGHYWLTAPSGTANAAITFAQAMTLYPSGALSIGNTTDRGAASLNVSGLIFPQQAATAPTYVKGAIYFDTSLNKLRVGGATGWETITSV